MSELTHVDAVGSMDSSAVHKEGKWFTKLIICIQYLILVASYTSCFEGIRSKTYVSELCTCTSLEAQSPRNYNSLSYHYIIIWGTSERRSHNVLYPAKGLHNKMNLLAQQIYTMVHFQFVHNLLA